MKRTDLSYQELCDRAMGVRGFEHLPKNPEMGQICMYLNSFSGCTYTFVEWVGVLGWVWIADE